MWRPYLVADPLMVYMQTMRGQWIADILFPKGLLQQLGLYAEFGEHLRQSPVLIFEGSGLGDHRRVHATMLRPPFVKGCRTHTMFAAKLGDLHLLSAWRRIARIWRSLYLLIFIGRSSVILPREFYPRSPLLSGEIPA